ncbi:hypothetical protein IOLA_137 [uncultured bacterium]|nr:hypothetical protein IOLA_137 [uncultured bacterium]
MKHIEIKKNYFSNIEKVHINYKINKFYKEKFNFIYDNIIIFSFLIYLNYFLIILIIDLSSIINIISHINYYKFINKYLNNIYCNYNFNSF